MIAKIYEAIFGRPPLEMLNEQQMQIAVLKRLRETREGVTLEVNHGFVMNNVITRVTVSGQDYFSEMLLGDFLHRLGLADIQDALDAVRSSVSYSHLSDYDELTKKQARLIRSLQKEVASAA